MVREASLREYAFPRDAMSDLDPATIERLLHDAARRHGVSVGAYRGLIQATAEIAGVSFEVTLLVTAVFEKMPAGERNALFEQFAIIQEEAVRYGVSVASLIRIVLGGGDGKSFTRH